MALYVPSTGEIDNMLCWLSKRKLYMTLYANQVSWSNDTTYASLTPATVEGGVDVKALVGAITTSALTASKWYVANNSAGKAEAKYSNATQTWTMDAANVATGQTMYGVALYCYYGAFTSGGGAYTPKVGDTLTGATSTKTAVITDIILTGGTWAGADATGYFFVELPNGAFQAENLNVAANNDVATIAADWSKKLIYGEAFTSGKLVDTVGQTISYWPVITGSTA